MSPTDALDLLRREHTPYIPQVVLVSDDTALWRDPTVEEQAAELEWWCDGCNRAADRCTVATVLALVDQTDGKTNYRETETDGDQTL